MRVREVLVLMCLLLVLSAVAERRLRCGCYNVENLFDTLHDEGRNDYEFLPDGSHSWNTYRYWRKLHHIAKVVAAMSEDYGPPIFLGLCEVENDSCLRDLTRRSELRQMGYDFLITNGPDTRGVETAMLYQSLFFRVAEHRGVHIPSLEHGYRPTRDILYVKGVLHTGDTLHVAVVHFPSRARNSSATSANRMLAAKTLRHLADSLRDEAFIVMGDFNAEPSDVIFRSVLLTSDSPLISLVTQNKKRLRKAEGTYVFRGQWGYLDHILITEPMRKWISGEAFPFKRPFILTEKGTPYRTYSGPAYRRGYSDHLPIVVDMVIP